MALQSRLSLSVLFLLSIALLAAAKDPSASDDHEESRPKRPGGSVPFNWMAHDMKNVKKRPGGYNPFNWMDMKNLQKRPGGYNPFNWMAHDMKNVKKRPGGYNPFNW